MLPYEYDRDLPLNLETVGKDEYKLLTFDAPYQPVVPESRRVYVHYYESKKPFMNLIFLHGIRNSNIPYLEWFAKWFAKHGVNSFYLILPYHGKRAPDGWKGGEPFFDSSPAWCVQRFHEAVKDVRRTIDVIESLNDLPVSVMGYSFGGMIATMVMGIDERINKGIISFSGGDWHWINWHSPVTDTLRKMYKEKGNEYGCRSEEDCLRMRPDPESIARSFKSVRDIFEKSPVGCFYYDPISYAPFVRNPVLVFRGIFDKVIPKKATDILVKLLPNKKVVWIPSGHKSSYLFRRLIALLSLNFLTNPSTFNTSM